MTPESFLMQYQSGEEVLAPYLPWCVRVSRFPPVCTSVQEWLPLRSLRHRFPRAPPPSLYGLGSFVGPELIGRRLHLYWALDRRWFVGVVTGFEWRDEESRGLHRVKYDDGDEELLHLATDRVS